MSAGAWFVFEYYLVGFRRHWRARLLISFGLPLLTLLGIGLGVGHFVADGFDGIPYVQWIVPGLIASTAMTVAVGDSTWPVLAKHSWTGMYRIQLSTPLRVADILGGHLAFVLLRVLISCTALLAVAVAFGAIRSAWSLVTVPVVLLLGLSVAAPTFAYSSTVPSETYFSLLLRLVVMPMSLFAGVFFPVDALPLAARALAYATPLWSGVSVIRATLHDVTPGWPIGLHLLYLALWAAVGLVLAYYRFRRRLIG